MTKNGRALSIAFATVFGIGIGVATAQVTGNFGTPPKLVPYSGYLENNAMPVSGTVDLSFYLVTDPAAGSGSAVWQENHPSVVVSGGRFGVMLGQTTGFGTLFADVGELYVGVSIDGVDLAGKQRLASAPYGISAGEANNFTVRGLLTAEGAVNVNGTLTALNAATVNGTFTAQGTANLNGTTNLNGAVNVPNADPVFRGVKISRNWAGFPDAVTYQAEISNDTNSYKALMIAGNQSSGARQVNLYDNVFIPNRLRADGDLQVDNNSRGACSSQRIAVPAVSFADDFDTSIALTACPAGKFMAGVYTKQYTEGSNFRDRWVTYLYCCEL